MRTAIQITVILAVAILTACVTTPFPPHQNPPTPPNQLSAKDAQLRADLDEVVEAMRPLMEDDQRRLKYAVKRTHLDVLRKDVEDAKTLIGIQMDEQGNPNWSIANPTALKFLYTSIQIKEEEIRRREKLIANLKQANHDQFEKSKALIKEEKKDILPKLTDHEIEWQIQQFEQTTWHGNPPKTFKEFTHAGEPYTADQIYDTILLFLLREEQARRQREQTEDEKQD